MAGLIPGSSRVLLFAAVALLIVGCGESTPPETAASQSAAASAASNWTPEMKAKFKAAMAGHQMTASRSGVK